MPFDAEITQKSRDLIVLEKARERIARGWCQGSLYWGGHYCVLGALVDAKHSLWCQHYPSLHGLGCDRVGLLGFETTDEAWEWNDAPGRTQAEVLTRFDEAIAKLSME